MIADPFGQARCKRSLSQAYWSNVNRALVSRPANINILQHFGGIHYGRSKFIKICSLHVGSYVAYSRIKHLVFLNMLRTKIQYNQYFKRSCNSAFRVRIYSNHSNCSVIIAFQKENLHIPCGCIIIVHHQIIEKALNRQSLHEVLSIFEYHQKNINYTSSNFISV